jgi:hypothetical protein
VSVAVAQDQGQEVVEIVGDPAGQLAQDLQSLRLPGLELLPLRLHPFPVGHVADGGRDDDPLVHLQGRQGDLGRELTPVPAPPGQVEPGSHGTGGGVGEVAPAVAGVELLDRVGDEDLDELADQFLPAVTEHSFDMAVDVHDPPVGVDAHHGVGRRLQQPPEPRLGPPTVGAVPHRGGHEPAFLRLERAEADLRREGRPVGPYCGQFPSAAHGPEDRLGDIPVSEHRMPGPGFGRDQHLDRPADHGRPAMAEEHLGLEVEEADLAGAVDHDEGVGHGIEDRGHIRQTHPNLHPTQAPPPERLS